MSRFRGLRAWFFLVTSQGTLTHPFSQVMVFEFVLFEHFFLFGLSPILHDWSLFFFLFSSLLGDSVHLTYLQFFFSFVDWVPSHRFIFHLEDVVLTWIPFQVSVVLSVVLSSQDLLIPFKVLFDRRLIFCFCADFWWILFLLRLRSSFSLPTSFSSFLLGLPPSALGELSILDRYPHSWMVGFACLALFGEFFFLFLSLTRILFFLGLVGLWVCTWNCDFDRGQVFTLSPVWES